MTKATFTAYKALTVNDPSNGDHVSVESSEGDQWGCFGDSPATMRTGGRSPQVCATGQAYAGWANLLVGNDNAGVTYWTTGRCHNVANRIMVLAGQDARMAGADALLMYVYGKYGFGIADFIARVNSSAKKFNDANQGILTQGEIDAVIARIGQAKQDELEILDLYFKQILQPQGLEIPPDQLMQIAAIYGDYFDKRNGFELNLATYQANIVPVITAGLAQIQKVIGNDVYQKVFKLLPEFAANVFQGKV